MPDSGRPADALIEPKLKLGVKYRDLAKTHDSLDLQYRDLDWHTSSYILVCGVSCIEFERQLDREIESADFGKNWKQEANQMVG